MTDVVVALRVEDPLSDVEPVATDGWFRIRPSMAYTAAGDPVYPAWPNPIPLVGVPVTVKLDPLPSIPYELEGEIPDGDSGMLPIHEFRFVPSSGVPVNWGALTLVTGPAGGAAPTDALVARVTTLETNLGSVSGGASNLGSITDMSPPARNFNAQTSVTNMRDNLLAAPKAAPTFTGTATVANLVVSGTTSFVDGSIAQADVAGLPALASSIALKADLNPTTGLVDAADIDPAIARQTDVTAAFASVSTPTWSNIVGVPTGRTYIDLILPGGVAAPRSSVGAIPPGWAVNWVSPVPPPIGGPYMLSVDTYERASV